MCTQLRTSPETAVQYEAADKAQHALLWDATAPASEHQEATKQGTVHWQVHQETHMTVTLPA